MFSIVLLGSCGKEGCTDVYSVDYNPEATKDDGSCSVQRNIKFSVTIQDTSFNNFKCLQEGIYQYSCIFTSKIKRCSANSTFNYESR